MPSRVGTLFLLLLAVALMALASAAPTKDVHTMEGSAPKGMPQAQPQAAAPPSGKHPNWQCPGTGAACGGNSCVCQPNAASCCRFSKVTKTFQAITCHTNTACKAGP